MTKSFVTLIGEATQGAVAAIIVSRNIHVNPAHIANCIRTEICSTFDLFYERMQIAEKLGEQIQRELVSGYVLESAMNVLKRAGYFEGVS